MPRNVYASDHWNRAGADSSISPCDRSKVQLVDNVCTSDFIYYELFRFNNTYESGTPGLYGVEGVNVPATFRENRTTPLLSKPSDYKMAVQSFSVPACIIPMLLINNVNEYDRFTIYMEAWLNNDPTLPLITASDYMYSQLAIQPNNVPIYNIFPFIEELNDTILRVFNALVTAYNAASPVTPWADNDLLPQVPVFVVYDAPSSLFTWYAPIQMDGNTPPSPSEPAYYHTDIRLSNNLVDLFRGCNFYFNSLNPAPNQSGHRSLVFYTQPENSNVIVFTNPGASNTQYIASQQTYSSIAEWYQFKKLAIVSNGMGLRKQALGFQKDVYSPAQVKTNDGLNNNNIEKGIIADYDLNIDNSSSFNPATRLIYSANEYRWIDFFDDKPLYQLDCELYLITRRNTLYQLQLPSNDGFNIKFVFAKKIF